MDSPLAAQFLLSGGKRGVLLIHGFTGTPAQMLPLGRALNAQGYTSLGVLLPGHGTSVEDMERRTWADWLQGAREAYEALARQCDEVFVLGLSMGAILALILAEEKPVRAAVSISAPLRLVNRSAYYAFLAAPFIRYRAWPKSAASTTVAAELENEYYLSYDSTPVAKVPDLLRLVRMAERGLRQIRCPLLIVQPQKDRTVRLDSPDLIYAGAVNASYKEILRLENSRHVCTIEPEFEKLFGTVSEFLKGRAHAVSD